MVPSPALVPSPSTAQMVNAGGMGGPMLRQTGNGSNVTKNGLQSFYYFHRRRSRYGTFA